MQAAERQREDSRRGARRLFPAERGRPQPSVSQFYTKPSTFVSSPTWVVGPLAAGSPDATARRRVTIKSTRMVSKREEKGGKVMSKKSKRVAMILVGVVMAL